MSINFFGQYSSSSTPSHQVPLLCVRLHPVAHQPVLSQCIWEQYFSLSLSLCVSLSLSIFLYLILFNLNNYIFISLLEVLQQNSSAIKQAFLSSSSAQRAKIFIYNLSINFVLLPMSHGRQYPLPPPPLGDSLSLLSGHYINADGQRM